MDEAIPRQLGRLLDLARLLTSQEGINATAVEYLSVVKRSSPSTPSMGVMNPAFCLVLQGTKVVAAGDRQAVCGAGNFLASAIEVPAMVHVVASKEQPYIGVVVHFTEDEVAGLVAESGILPPLPEGGIQEFVGTPHGEFLDLVEKILTLDNTAGDRFRARLLKRELAFCLLSGPYGHLFAPRAAFDPRSGVRRAVAWVREHFREPLAVETLADDCAMSVSSLHHRFKAATAQSPVQFQKLLRLQEARRLIVQGSHDATTAAYEVGYQSLSHFTREYRRLFGVTPGKDGIKTQREGIS